MGKQINVTCGTWVGVRQGVQGRSSLLTRYVNKIFFIKDSSDPKAGGKTCQAFME